MKSTIYICYHPQQAEFFYEIVPSSEILDRHHQNPPSQVGSCRLGFGPIGPPCTSFDIEGEWYREKQFQVAVGLIVNRCFEEITKDADMSQCYS